MTKRYVSGDDVYDLRDVDGMRELLIELRDAALSIGDMERAVGLSHCIKLLALIIKEMDA
jgi:hypothetical protein